MVLKKITAAITILITFGLLSSTSPSPADSNSEWQKQLNEFQWEIAENTDNIPTEPSDLTNELPTQLQQFQTQINNRSVKIGIAYGSEKEHWLKWAQQKFKEMQFKVLGEGKDLIKIELIRMGSIEGAKTILKQDADARLIHVWIPASSLVRGLLVEQWNRAKNCAGPILSGTPLVYTPLVILIRKKQYKEFIAKYHRVDFNTIAQALSERTGWAAIADKPEWGIFTFGHTTPTHSNSGLLALVLMAYNYYYLSKPDLQDDEEIQAINLEQIQDDSFLAWLKNTQENIWTDSDTRKLMEVMLDWEPPEVESIIIYENLALEKLEKAKKAANPEKKLKMIYPTLNVWNDNPYYILNVPWSSKEQRLAAKLFQEFLLSEKAQKIARDNFSFRPANSKVPLLVKNNRFDKFQNRVQVPLNTVPVPQAEVLEQLLEIWESNDSKEIITY